MTPDQGRHLAENIPCDVCSYPHGHPGHTEPECDQCDADYAGITDIRLEDAGGGETVIYYRNREGRACGVGTHTRAEADAFLKRYGGRDPDPQKEPR